MRITSVLPMFQCISIQNYAAAPGAYYEPQLFQSVFACVSPQFHQCFSAFQCKSMLQLARIQFLSIALAKTFLVYESRDARTALLQLQRNSNRSLTKSQRTIPFHFCYKPYDKHNIISIVWCSNIKNSNKNSQLLLNL